MTETHSNPEFFSALVDPMAFRRAQEVAAKTGDPFDAVLVRLGLLSEDRLQTAYAALGHPTIAAAQFPTTPILPDSIHPGFLRLVRALPVGLDEAGILLAMADPTDDASAGAIAFATGQQVRRVVARASDIAATLDRLYPENTASVAPGTLVQEDDVERLRDLASDAPIVRLVQRWIEEAVEAGASDIHIEPTEHDLRLRNRIDGVLVDRGRHPPSLHAAIVSRLKIMARIDIAERRIAQDGRIGIAVRGQEVDLRVSVVPTVRGESVVLRILDRTGIALDFAALGFDRPSLARYLGIVERPHGIVLVTGPTGSGKSTTLYTSLLMLRRPDVKVLTVEDPVEYRLDGINQTQAQPGIGFDFAEVLRAFLRHDPDILMVGEIRDRETAAVAVQAALTGRLVLSTLHTNDAASTITRMINLGVEDYLLTATINGIVAQRLVRKLCPACRRPYRPSADVLVRIGIEGQQISDDAALFAPVGCAVCHGIGYRGREAIYEVLVFDETLRDLVMRRAPISEVQRAACAAGMVPMFANGIGKALEGITSIDEVFRVTRGG